MEHQEELPVKQQVEHQEEFQVPFYKLAKIVLLAVPLKSVLPVLVVEKLREKSAILLFAMHNNQLLIAIFGMVFK